MKHVGHFIAGELLPTDDGSQIFNQTGSRPQSPRSVLRPTSIGLSLPPALPFRPGQHRGCKIARR
jgi:hypothetical protein